MNFKNKELAGNLSKHLMYFDTIKSVRNISELVVKESPIVSKNGTIHLFTINETPYCYSSKEAMNEDYKNVLKKIK